MALFVTVRNRRILTCSHERRSGVRAQFELLTTVVRCAIARVQVRCSIQNVRSLRVVAASLTRWPAASDPAPGHIDPTERELTRNRRLVR